MNLDRKNVFRLQYNEGEEKVGLIVKKKSNDDVLFKKPQTSLLGLDALALTKRNKQESGKEKEKFKYERENKRHYRDSRIESPSPSSGVNDDYLLRKKLKEKKERRKRLKGYYFYKETPEWRRNLKDYDKYGKSPKAKYWDDDDFSLDKSVRSKHSSSWESTSPSRSSVCGTPSTYFGSKREMLYDEGYN